MKTKFITTILLACFGLHAGAQFTLEHTYPNNGFFKVEPAPNFGAGYAYGVHSLYLVNLEFDGEKYVDIDRLNQTLNLYNLNHSLYKIIDYSAVYTGVSAGPVEDKVNASIMYISQNLFDGDSAIEFLYTHFFFNHTTTSFRAITQIVKDNGTIIFSDSASPMVRTNFHQQYYPIYNTTNGTKMILSHVNGTAEVFSLPGTLTGYIQTNNILSDAHQAQMNLFPNPVNQSGNLTINYTLPADEKTATLLIYDQYGKQLKALQIGNAMKNVMLNTGEFSPGLYYYSIVSSNGSTIQSKKSVVVD